jgi:hypothetical protein
MRSILKTSHDRLVTCHRTEQTREYDDLMLPGLDARTEKGNDERRIKSRAQ